MVFALVGYGGQGLPPLWGWSRILAFVVTDAEEQGLESILGLCALSSRSDRRKEDFRKVMPLASKETKGRADGKRVNEIVREMTA